jgi:lysozyme family protein
MALIGYDEKNKAATPGTAPALGRDVDFNEIKEVVNTNATQMGFKAVWWTPPATIELARFPDPVEFPETDAIGTGPDGAIMNGNRIIMFSGGYVPSETNPADGEVGRKMIAEALEDNPGQDPAKWKVY